MTSGRIAPSPPPVWAGPAAAGWVPTLADIRDGYRRRPPGRMAAPVVPDSRRSAILVAVFEDDGGARVVLIERSKSSGTHRGDIAFPGGVLHEGETARDGVLRETWEEVGIPPGDVEIIASLDAVATYTGFVIQPFVGLLPGRPDFVVDTAEVERALSVPLTELIRDGAHWWQRWGPDPRTLLSYFAVGDAVGWGTTGDLLVDLLTTACDGRAGRAIGTTIAGNGVPGADPATREGPACGPTTRQANERRS